MGRGNLSPSLSGHDAAIWHTVDIVQRCQRGGVHDRPTIAPTFVPHLGSGELLFAQGTFELADYRAAGDGSYAHNGGFFLAGGAVGLAATGAFAAGRAIGNSRRRAQAASDAIQCWRPLSAGTIWVGTHGFYLHDSGGLLSWSFGSVTGMELVGPGAATLSGNSDRGPIYWILQSEWVELAFALWALAVYPQHPQFTSFTWIPPGWQERVATAGHQLPSVGRTELSG